MNQPIPWLFPDKVAQNTFCPGGAPGWFYKLLWTEVSLHTEGGGSASSSQESLTWQPAVRRGLCPLGIVPKACASPVSGCVRLGCPLGGTLWLPECGPAVPAGDYGQAGALPGWHRPGRPGTLSGCTRLAERRAQPLATFTGRSAWCVRLLTGNTAFGSVGGPPPPISQSATFLSATEPGGFPPSRTFGHCLKGTGAGDGKGSFWRQLIQCGHSPRVAGFRETKKSNKPGCPVQLECHISNAYVFSLSRSCAAVAH